MTTREAALHYAASLIEGQLASAFVERVDGAPGRPLRIAPQIFEKAPPNVAVALANGLNGEAVAEEMAKLAEELRHKVKTEVIKHRDWCDLVVASECSCDDGKRE